jgi:hypothetical protein
MSVRESDWIGVRFHYFEKKMRVAEECGGFEAKPETTKRSVAEGGEKERGNSEEPVGGLTRRRPMDAADHDPQLYEAVIRALPLHPSVRPSRTSLQPPVPYSVLAGPLGLRCSDTARRCPKSQSRRSGSVVQ